MVDFVKNSLPNLSAAERRVAEVLLHSPEEFVGLGSDAIAAQAAVSKPTVVRFSRSLGFGGVRELKQHLAASLAEGVPFIHRAVSLQDKTATLTRKVLENTISALIELRNIVSESAVSQCVSLLAHTHAARGHLVFIGVGNSGMVAMDAQHKFFRLGFAVQAIADGHTQLMAASMLTPNDCLVVVSNSGRTNDLIEAADVAKKNGCPVIVITASGSPLSASGTIHLAADHPESYEEFTPMVSRIVHLALLDVLATAVALRVGANELRPRLQKMKQLLSKKRYTP